METVKTTVTARSYIRKRSSHFTVRLPKNCTAFHVVNSGTDIMMGDTPLKPGQQFSTRCVLVNAIVFTVWKGCAFVLTTETLP